MGMGFLWESHGKRPVGWDGTGMNCYGMGMGQINMSRGQPCGKHSEKCKKQKSSEPNE